MNMTDAVIETLIHIEWNLKDAHWMGLSYRRHW